ncbi:glycoprotein-N-acetylgalactosamine 3-beta-galactosyltransferase 1-like [Mercenaria mercenaria]|uniref:glycoprotein-N-acetylgalactosamine 3-beta-galactosyltransferase 1-like n=1 Tax=Mercenaria mercenaria TaxID=6596 RepID=UPI00234ED86C|nr:glycoprotein-N-acetylgalactosamine 3-beta-galactosyltransferase 1-like [Mercenaria mercenaria]
MTLPYKSCMDICHDDHVIKCGLPRQGLIVAVCIAMNVFVLTQFKAYPVVPNMQEKGVYTVPSCKCTNNSHRRDIRVLCLILANGYEDQKMTAISKTWAVRCDKHLFINGQTNMTKKAKTILNVPVPEKRKHLTRKVQRALEHVYRTYKGSYDWILKCDTDTFVIMENLRHLLSFADSNKPGYLGFHIKTMKTERNGYMSGGAAYAISWQGLHQLMHKGFKNGCCEQDGAHEDLRIGLCLAVRTMYQNRIIKFIKCYTTLSRK